MTRQRCEISQITTSRASDAVGLTGTAPAAYYVVAGTLDRNAWALWMANLLFAGDQIHYVQVRIRSARVSGWWQKFATGRGFLLGQMLLVTALLFAWRFELLPTLAVLAFLPLLVRGTAWFFERRKPLIVRRIGWTELAHSIIFGIGLIVGFHLSR